MFITAVCVIFLIKLRWPKSKSLYDTIVLLYSFSWLDLLWDSSRIFVDVFAVYLGGLPYRFSGRRVDVWKHFK